MSSTELEAGESWNVVAKGGIRAPVNGSSYYASDSTEWQSTEAKGFWIKPLYEDSARGEKTMLMKVEPGAFSPLHNHKGEFEQIYVLEGSFYDQHKTMGVGDHCCRAPEAFHSAGSTEGAVVMLIYTRREPE